MHMNKEVVMVRLTDIIPNRFQPRLTFDEEALNELANSIKEHGIIQPLILRDLGSKYEIIAGERRYKAATIAGLTEVPAIIGSMDDQTSAEVALIENIQRKDLSAIEEAKSYQKVLELGNLTQETLAKRMGKGQSTIANKMRLLTLTNEVQVALMNNLISERHARCLLQIKDEDKQKEVFERQLMIAQKYNKSIVVHSRNSVQDAYDILKKYNLKGTIHCFSSSLEMANEFIKLGYKIGVGGIVTFKNSIKLQEIIKNVNIENLLLETDSPFLTPEPFRGLKNEPANVYLVAKKVSDIKNINVDDVIRITGNSAKEEFDLKI